MKFITFLTIVANLFIFNAGQFAGMDLKGMASGPNGIGGSAAMIDMMLGTNSSKCPPLFVTTPNQCLCINIVPVNPPISYMEASKYCYTKLDNRSVILTVNSQSEYNTFSSSIGAYAPSMGINNVPIGVYLSDNGNVRSLLDQSIANYSNSVGKCKYFVPDANVTANASCMHLVSSVACQLPCDTFSYPPAPNTAPGTDRCNKSGFNANCETGWINLGGVCYKNPVDNNTLLTYADAFSKCQSIGGWLPSISNQQEWDALTKYVYNTGISGAESFAAPMWLGGTLSGTTGTWTDGTPWQFQYWAGGEPKTTSSCMWWSVGQGDYWSTGNCTQPAVVFCQQYPPCFTTTTTTTTIPTTTTSTTTSTKTTTTTTTTPSTTTTTSTPTTTTTTTTKPSTTSTTTTTTTLPSTTTTSTATVPKSSPSSTSTETSTTTSKTSTTLSPSSTSTATTSTTSTVALSSSTSPSTSLSSTTFTTTSTSTTPTPSTSTTSAASTTSVYRPIADCLLNHLSFIRNGVCYELLSVPCSEVAHAGVIRSADIGEKLIHMYNEENPSSTAVMFWIGYQNNNASEYKVLNNSLTSDDDYMMLVDLNNVGECPTLQWNMTSKNLMLINSSTPCTTENQLYFCETWPTFEQKACNQSLITTGVQVITTMSVPTALECSQYCLAESWCLSVNYNPSTKSCQSVAANMTSKSLVCDLGWNYYEKI